MSQVYDCADRASRAEGLEAASAAVRNGRLVVLPTDTVYGIGCDAFDDGAVTDLLAAKRRGPDMPVGVLVGSWSTIDGLVLGVPKEARKLIEAFWPGDLSLVLHHAPSLTWNLGTTRGTVMVRMPLHPVALDLLRDTGPMAVTSANKSGMPPAKSAGEAHEYFAEEVEVYLESGAVGDPVPSSIVDLTGSSPVLLREGAVSADAVSEVLGSQVETAG